MVLSSAAVLVGCWLGVVAAVAMVAVVALVAVVAAVAAAAFGGAAGHGGSSSRAVAKKWCCCQCISATGAVGTAGVGTDVL